MDWPDVPCCSTVLESECSNDESAMQRRSMLSQRYHRHQRSATFLTQFMTLLVTVLLTVPTVHGAAARTRNLFGDRQQLMSQGEWEFIKPSNDCLSSEADASAIRRHDPDASQSLSCAQITQLYNVLAQQRHFKPINDSKAKESEPSAKRKRVTSAYNCLQSPPITSVVFKTLAALP